MVGMGMGVVYVALRAMSADVGRRPRAMSLAPLHGGYGHGHGLRCTTGHERKCGAAAAGHVVLFYYPPAQIANDLLVDFSKQPCLH
jgi:hypothetical protein